MVTDTTVNFRQKNVNNIPNTYDHHTTIFENLKSFFFNHAKFENIFLFQRYYRNKFSTSVYIVKL